MKRALNLALIKKCHTWNKHVRCSTIKSKITLTVFRAGYRKWRKFAFEVGCWEKKWLAPILIHFVAFEFCWKHFSSLNPRFSTGFYQFWNVCTYYLLASEQRRDDSQNLWSMGGWLTILTYKWTIIIGLKCVDALQFVLKSGENFLKKHLHPQFHRIHPSSLLSIGKSEQIQ